MKNPIFKAYEKFDNGMMYLSNKAVRKYNWLTGGTKADLSDKVFLVAGGTSGLATLDPIAAPVLTAVHLAMYLLTSLKNKKIEKLEKAAQEKGCLNLEVEGNKLRLKGIPLIYLTGSTLFSPFLKYKIPFNILLGGYITDSYIMRADYQKPRKTNALQRAKRKYGRKLKAKIKGLAPNPEPIPQPAFVRLNSLEERLE